MRNFRKNVNHGLKTGEDGNTVKASGVETHDISGSRSVNSAHDFPYFYNSDALYLFADLREPACVSMSGMSGVMFLTPDQARFFCARRKARKEHNIKSPYTRRHHDLPTHEPDTDPGRRRAAERGHEIHPETTAYAAEDRGRSRVAFPQSARSLFKNARHEIHRGVSYQRHRVHLVHLPNAVTGIRQVRFIGLVNNQKLNRGE